MLYICHYNVYKAWNLRTLNISSIGVNDIKENSRTEHSCWFGSFYLLS